MKINKIRLKFQFWTKIEIKITYLVFVFCYLSTFKILRCTNSKKKKLLVQLKILNVDKTASKWL